MTPGARAWTLVPCAAIGFMNCRNIEVSETHPRRGTGCGTRRSHLTANPNTAGKRRVHGPFPSVAAGRRAPAGGSMPSPACRGLLQEHRKVGVSVGDEPWDRAQFVRRDG